MREARQRAARRGVRQRPGAADDQPAAAGRAAREGRGGGGRRTPLGGNAARRGTRRDRRRRGGERRVRLVPRGLRFERLAERRVHVDRARLRMKRGVGRERRRRGEPFERARRFVGEAQVEREADEAAEEVRLVDRLRRGAALQFRRPVGRDGDQRRAGEARLDDRGEVVRGGRARRADEQHRRPGRLGRAEREEGRGALVHDDRRLDRRLARRGEGERRRTGAGTDDGAAHAGRGEAAHEEGGPRRVEVARAHQIPRASPIVRSFAAISSNSRAASEAATIPAPA